MLYKVIIDVAQLFFLACCRFRGPIFTSEVLAHCYVILLCWVRHATRAIELNIFEENAIFVRGTEQIFRKYAFNFVAT